VFTNYLSTVHFRIHSFYHHLLLNKAYHRDSASTFELEKLSETELNKERACVPTTNDFGHIILGSL
jgi:hypothetical protein